MGLITARWTPLESPTTDLNRLVVRNAPVNANRLAEDELID